MSLPSKHCVCSPLSTKTGKHWQVLSKQIEDSVIQSIFFVQSLFANVP